MFNEAGESLAYLVSKNTNFYASYKHFITIANSFFKVQKW